MDDATRDRQGVDPFHAAGIPPDAASPVPPQMGLWERDLASEEGRWSAELWRMLGLAPRPQAPPFDEWMRWIHPGDRERVHASHADALRGEGSPEVTFRVIPPDGRTRVVRSQVFGDFGHGKGDGKRVVFGITQDVTAQVEAEHAHAAMLALFRSAIEVVPEALVVRRADGGTVWHNRAYQQLFGRTEAEIAEAGLGAFISPEDHVRLRAWHAEIDRTGHEVAPPVLTATHPDGTKRYWEPVFGDHVVIDGEPIGRVLAGRDVTDRVLLEQSLAERSADFDAIFTAAPRAMVVIDESGAILRCNPEVMTTFGWPEGTLVGQHVGVLAADLTPAVHDQYMRHYMRTGAAATVEGLVIGRQREVRARRRDGATFPALLTVAELPPRSNGRRFLGIIVDLTEQHAREEQVRILQKNEALGTLVAGVAHDFNNLLTAILGSLYMAQEGRDGLQRWLEMATEGAERAALLVRQLLQFARPGTAEIEPVDFAAAARETVRLLGETSDRRVQFTVESVAGVPPVSATPSGAQQILMNLLMNARDAVLERLERAESGGATDEVPAGRVTVSVRLADADQSRVLVCVQDNGAGVPPEIRDRIFDPFFTTKGPGRGTGLGLSTVLTLVRQFGGAITCEAAPGGGAVFTVLLPAAELSGAQSAPPAQTEPHGGEGPLRLAGTRVLLVDDNDDVRDLVQTVLEDAGASVIAARSGREALAMIETRDANVAVFDINMPGMTGWEFLEHARAIAPKMRLIVLSGYIDEALVRRHRPDAVLHKPCSHEALIAAAAGGRA